MKALIITGKYATDQEVFYPLYRLQEEGYEVDVAVCGGKTVLSDLGRKIEPTMDIPKLMVAEYWRVLVLPGGAKAMEYMRQEGSILNFIARFHQRGGIVASICHGAQLLISAGLVKGRRISGYYSIKDDITNAGGIYVDAPFVTDGRIVSSPHYKHLGPWMREVIKQVAPSNERRAVADNDAVARLVPLMREIIEELTPGRFTYSWRGGPLHPEGTQMPTAGNAHLHEW